MNTARSFIKCAAVFITLFITCSCQNNNTVYTVLSKTSSDNVFSENVLFQVQIKSKSECASLCRMENCMTFTFQPPDDLNATLKNCRGHSAVMTLSNAKTAAVGARTYAVKATNIPAPVDPKYRCPFPVYHCGDKVTMAAAGCATTGNYSGIYKINGTLTGATVDAYCDQLTDGGGWMVFLRRKDGSVNFKDGTWANYKAGFGDLSGEHWLGLEMLHQITQALGGSSNILQYELRVDMTRKSDSLQCYSVHDHFEVWTEADNYKMGLWTQTSDTCDGRNWLSGHSGRKFSTCDRDNDDDSATQWAKYFWGGFWHHADTTANPTGYFSCANHPSSTFWGRKIDGMWTEQCSFIEYKIRKRV